MECFHVHQRLLFISMFFIVSILATEVPISSPGPSPTLLPVSSPNAEPESSPTSSSLPSLIQISVPSSPEAGGEESPEGPDGEVLISVQSDAPESVATEVPTSSPGPSPTLLPVSSPNAEPDSSGDSPEGPEAEVPVPLQSDAPESNAPESETEPYSEPKQETANANTEVKKACESTDYPSLCINTIDPLVKPKNEVSLDTVLEVSIKATNDLAKAAQVMAKNLANTPGTPSELASVLKVCEESYDDALDNFQTAMEAYDTRDVGTMNTMLSAVITDIGDCNDEFSSLNIPSPIAEFAEKLTNMTSNCLAIISLLQY